MNKNKIISSLKTMLTTALIVLANIAAVAFVDYISADFNYSNWYDPIIIVIAITIANSILWPIFRRFLMKFILLTFGIGAIFINSLIFYIATYPIPGVYVGFYGFWQVPIVMAIVTTFMTNITNTNYYDRYIKIHIFT